MERGRANRAATIQQTGLDLSAFRDRVRSIKETAAQDPSIADAFAEAVRANGGRVFFAKTGQEAVQYVLDVCRANGFSEALKIGHLAAAHGLMVSPHVVHEISLHVAAALPNAFLVEYMNWAPDDLFVDLPKCENGWFRVPERPGHGLMLTPDALKKYKAR